jgi:MarR family transcriptional regulator, organic hydroperoxide resistance regulator
MEKKELIQKIIGLQRRVNRVLREADTDVWMDLTLSVPQLKSLFFIANQGRTSSRKLAERLKVTPSNVTGIIDRLVDQGLVSRTENPEDRRVLLLQATNRGEALVSRLREKRDSHLALALQDLALPDLADIARSLEVLARVTEEHSPQAEPT